MSCFVPLMVRFLGALVTRTVSSKIKCCKYSRARVLEETRNLKQTLDFCQKG